MQPDQTPQGDALCFFRAVFPKSLQRVLCGGRLCHHIDLLVDRLTILELLPFLGKDGH